MKWRIWYEDGTTFSDDDGTPDQSPIKLVACISSRTEQNTKWKLDWYYWHVGMGGWMGGDVHGLLYQACKDPTQLTVVRQGASNSYQFQPMLWDAFIERMHPE